MKSNVENNLHTIYSYKNGPFSVLVDFYDPEYCFYSIVDLQIFSTVFVESLGSLF